MKHIQFTTSMTTPKLFQRRVLFGKRWNSDSKTYNRSSPLTFISVGRQQQHLQLQTYHHYHHRKSLTVVGRRLQASSRSITSRTLTSSREQQLQTISTSNKISDGISVDQELDDFMRTIRNEAENFQPHRPKRNKRGTTTDDEINSNDNKPEPWKVLLEYPGRAAWRVSSTVQPLSYEHAATKLLSTVKTNHNKIKHRKYIRHIFETNIIKQQYALSLLRDRERIRILHRTSYTEYDQKRDTGITPIAYGIHEMVAHLTYRNFTYFSIIRRVLLEVQSLLYSNTSQNPIRRIFDFGCGCGTASAAAIHVFSSQQNNNNLEWIHGIDPSKTMREGAKFFLTEFIQKLNELFQEQRNEKDIEELQKNTVVSTVNQQDPTESATASGSEIDYQPNLSTSTTPNSSNVSDNDGKYHPIQPQLTFSANASTNVVNGENNTGNTNGTFDIAFMTYAAMELGQNAAILGAAGICWEKLRIGGIFVMIEPGTPDGFSNIRTVRNMLLDCFPLTETINDDGDNFNDSAVREVCHVIAPCTHSGRCPMERYHYKKYKDILKQQITQQTINKDEENEENTETTVDTNPDSSFENDKYQNVAASIKKSKKSKQDELEEADAENSLSDDDEGLDFDEIDKEDKDDDEEEEDGIQKGYCSFVHSIPGGSGKGEKFSYLVVQKRLSNATGNYNHESKLNVSTSANTSIPRDFDDINIPSILQRAIIAYQDAPEKDSNKVLYSDEALMNEAMDIEDQFLSSDSDDLGLELVRGDYNRNTYGRIIRAPRKHRGHVIIDTCVGTTETSAQLATTNIGKIVRTKICRSLSKQIPGIYGASRKSRWGGFWPTVPSLIEK